MTHNMEIYIRETCNEFYRIIIRRKGSYWFKSEETFHTMQQAVNTVQSIVCDMVLDMSDVEMKTVPKFRAIPTEDLLPEPNATKVFRVVPK